MEQLMEFLLMLNEYLKMNILQLMKYFLNQLIELLFLQMHIFQLLKFAHLI